VRLACYEILTNKNDVERRKRCDLQTPEYARRQLIGCQYIYIYICERKEGEKKKTSPPDHFRISYLSSFVFVLLLLLRRWSAKKKKDLLIEKERKKKEEN
jgi:uncharacterized protein YktB (UPF0637 family)